jgi:predicted nucleic acid-binding protein
MPGFVLDSFALIAYFRDEAGADKVEALLHTVASRHEPLHMTEVNYAEVQYIVIRSNGLAGWEAVADRLVALPISFHPVTREVADIAARFKAAHPISLADAFAAALAKIKDAELVTGDRDFKAVEKDLKKIRWLVGPQRTSSA